MNSEILKHYQTTSSYTDAGAYQDYLKSLPDDIRAIGMMICDQITHPSMYFTPPSTYLENKYFGKFSTYPKNRFKNEDELFITSAAMIAEIFRLDERGFVKGKDVTKRLTVSCRHASVLFSAILKAKGIPCRSRTGFVDFGNDGSSYTEHWVNEYWDYKETRWVLVDADGYYEYEERFGYSQFDLPRKKYIPAADAWIGTRSNNLNKKLDVYGTNVLAGVCEYLFMDFHSLMNNEIFYSYQPLYLRDRFDRLTDDELRELDDLAKLLQNPDDNFYEIKNLWNNNEKLYTLTNNTQNIYYDVFKKE